MTQPQLHPPTGGITRELLSVREALGLPRFWLRTLPRLPHGSGCVMVVPGFRTGDGATVVLRTTLRALGYDVRGWGLGRNNGDVDSLLPRLRARVLEAAQASNSPIALVGWSLGGYLAREVARDEPAAVRDIITLASPIIGGPKYTAAAGTFRARGVDLDALEARIKARDAVPLTTPVLALYSERDSIVCPAACIDHHNRHVEHIKLNRCTHTSFGLSPSVLRIVAERLARGVV